MSDCDLILTQELVGRKAKDQPSDWSKEFVKNLPHHVALTPTTDWNENYIIGRTDRSFSLRQQSDIVLTSPGGGKHLSRAQVLVGGRPVLEVRDSHLLTDADAKKRGESGRKCREQQAAQIVKDVKSTTLPYVLGMDANDTKPFDLGRLERVLADTDWSTFTTYSATRATKGVRIDHFEVDGVVVNSVETRGIRADGSFTRNPKPSDHLVVVIDITINL